MVIFQMDVINYNPFGKSHGCPGSPIRHKGVNPVYVGDLGNLKIDMFGNAKYKTSDDVIKYSIIGRSLIIHSNRDDCGLGGNEESLKTGNAGKRIACAIIGHARPFDHC